MLDNSSSQPSQSKLDAAEAALYRHQANLSQKPVFYYTVKQCFRLCRLLVAGMLILVSSRDASRSSAYPLQLTRLILLLAAKLVEAQLVHEAERHARVL